METQTKKRRGARPGERRQPRIDVLLTEELRHQVRVAAAEDDTGLGEWVAQAIREKLARRRPTPESNEGANILD